MTFLYAHLTRARRRYYEARPDRRRTLRQPVVSVGNLSVGGSGKTPVVELLVHGLLEWGRRPAVLTRGYARADAADGAVVVSEGAGPSADLARAGDEPLMLARNLRGAVVIVSPDRYLGGRLAERRFGCDVHVLDDGFQHVQLSRDVDLLLAGDEDLNRPFLLPKGRLREPLDAARHADALLWTGVERDAAGAAEQLRVPVVFAVRRSPGAVHPAAVGERALQAGARVVAAAGIARPRRFFDGLREAGFYVVSELTWPDHHRFAARDVERMRAAVAGSGADAMVTTEKDMVRLWPLGPLPFRAAWQRLDVRIEPAQAFDAWMAERLRRADARAAGRREKLAG